MDTGLAQAERPAAEQRLHIVQGEFHVTDASDVMLTTLLGSCVSACMRDPVAGIGGMNHFLLPGDQGGSDGGELLRYGVHAMELLVNGILSKGGRRERLEVSLFGGARMTARLTDVGNSNANFAEDFVKREGIRFNGGSLRGDRARRIQFWPVSGRVRQLLLDKGAQVAESAPPRPASVDVGQVELF